MTTTPSHSLLDAAPGNGYVEPGDLMKRVVQGAHDTVDRLAENVAPQVQRLEQGVSSASDALKAKADQIRITGDEWAQSVRGTVRDHPLVSVLAALALGALVARIMR